MPESNEWNVLRFLLVTLTNHQSAKKTASKPPKHCPLPIKTVLFSETHILHILTGLKNKKHNAKSHEHIVFSGVSFFYVIDFGLNRCPQSTWVLWCITSSLNHNQRPSDLHFLREGRLCLQITQTCLLAVCARQLNLVPLQCTCGKHIFLNNKARGGKGKVRKLQSVLKSRPGTRKLEEAIATPASLSRIQIVHHLNE